VAIAVVVMFPGGKEPWCALKLAATMPVGEGGAGLSLRSRLVLALEELLHDSDISDCKRSGNAETSIKRGTPPAVYSGFLKGIVNVATVP